MTDQANFPDDTDSAPRTITDEFFEREVHVSRREVADFLHSLADQIEADTSLTIAAADWELPFEYREPIEVEIELTPGRDRELEVELEFTGANGDQELSVG